MPTASPRLVVNHFVAVAESGVRNAPAANPTARPNVTWSCQSAVAWLDTTRPRPSSAPPAIVTARLPSRSDTAPQKNEPAPIAIQLMRAITEIALRLQCIESSSGLRKTPRENRAPCPMATTVAAAARITQP